MGWADRETAWVSLSQSPARRGSRRLTRLALCLSSLSVTGLTASRRHGVAALPLCLSPSRTLAQSPLALGLSLSFLLFFFLFFPLVFQVLLSPFGFGLLRAEIFSFSFFFLFLLWIDMGYGLCFELAG